MSTDNPCVRNCCLSEHDVCVGCFRHLNEILSWSEMNDAQKQATLELCQKRKEQHCRYVKKDLDSR